MDETNPLPGFLNSIIVVDLKPETRLAKLLRRLIAPACPEEENKSSLLDGLNQTDFDKLMILLDSEQDDI